MSDLISRKDAIEAVSGCGICLQNIIDLPYLKQRKGKWIKTEDTNILECSCCHSRWNIYYVCDFDYCPCCGTKMEGDWDEAD